MGSVRREGAAHWSMPHPSTLGEKGGSWEGRGRTTAGCGLDLSTPAPVAFVAVVSCNDEFSSGCRATEKVRSMLSMWLWWWWWLWWSACRRTSGSRNRAGSLRVSHLRHNFNLINIVLLMLSIIIKN